MVPLSGGGNATAAAARVAAAAARLAGASARVAGAAARVAAAAAGRVAGAAAAAVGAGPRLVARIIPRVTVEGPSMEPALAAGDRLLLLPVGTLRPGDIAAMSDPRNPEQLLVKRVKSVDRHNRLVVVEGDNADRSTDSRDFGPVARQAVLGRAVYRYAPARRAGRVARGR